jgi:hypothetical protein
MEHLINACCTSFHCHTLGFALQIVHNLASLHSCPILGPRVQTLAADVQPRICVFHGFPVAIVGLLLRNVFNVV